MHDKDALGVHLTSLIKWIFIASLVLLLQSNSLAVARNLQKIDASPDYQQINNALYILRDPSAKWVLEDILQDEVAVRFENRIPRHTRDDPRPCR